MLLYYQNVRGLRSKVHKLYTTVSAANLEVIMLTETWLFADILDSELLDGSYSVMRKDRDYVAVGGSVGGGVLAAFSECISVVPFDVSDVLRLVPLIDLVICKTLLLPLPVYFVVIYVPPQVTCDDYELFFDALSLKLLDKKLIVCGDFNCPKFSSPDNTGDRKFIVLENFMNTLNMQQFNNSIVMEGFWI